MTGNLQIYKAEPIITLQRSNNALLSGLSWQGSGGAEAASIKLDGTSGATNTLIMSTYNGSTMAERLRLMTNAAGGIAVTGTISVTGTVDGVDIAARDAILTSTTTTAGAALPKAGGTMTGTLSVNTGGSDANSVSNLSGDFSTWIRVGDMVGGSGQTQTNGYGIKFADAGVIHWSVGGQGSNFKISKTNTLGDELFPSGSRDDITITSAGQVGIGAPNTSVFNGVGGNSRLVVKGSDSSTNILNNSNASITIANDDGTASNTSALHFARADTDDNPHYAGASIVAQFVETQVTGQYPKGQLAFLTSTASNTAPSEKMRIDSSGDVGIGLANPLAKLHVNGDIVVGSGDSNQKIYLEGAVNDLNMIHRNTSENTTIMTARHAMAFIIDSNADDSDSGSGHFTVRKNGTTVAGSNEMFKILPNGDASFYGNHLQLPKSAANPTGTSSGQLYYDTTNNAVKFYDGSILETC